MGKVTTDYFLDAQQPINALLDIANQAQKTSNVIGTAADANKEAFKAGAADVINFNKQLADGTLIYKKIENSAESFRKEQERLKQVLADLKTRQKEFIAAGRYEELQQNIAGVKGRIKELGGELDNTEKKLKNNTKEGGLFGNMLGKLGGILGGIAIGAVIMGWGTSILNVTAEFQKFEVVLTTSLGSGSAAERALGMITDFAAKTPFSVQELTDSYVKLAGRGIKATAKEMGALGDLAASSGKSINQVVEAALDAFSGENERLKEVGITAKKTGETTQYTFKGVTTEVKNTDKAIKDYLISLGQVEGVAGSMAAVSETLTGRMSNLGDSIDNLWLTIGEQETGVMASFITFLGDAVTYTTSLIATTDQLGKKMAAGAISDFYNETYESYKKLAAETGKSGAELNTTLTETSKKTEAQLAADLKKAEANLAAFRANYGKAEAAITFLANPVQYGINKSTEAALAATVAKIKGQKAAITDAINDTVTESNKDADQKAAEAALKAKEAAAEAAKKAAADRKKALADLYKEVERLEADAAKARIGMMNKNSKEYLDAVLAADLKEIEQIEKQLIEKEKKAGLDGKLGVKQRQQLDLLIQAATKQYYDNLNKLTSEEEQKIFDLRADSDAKQLEAITRKYDKEIRAAEEAGRKTLAVELEAAKQRELAKAGKAQAINNLGTDKDLAIEFTRSVFSGGEDSIAQKRALEQALLDIEIEFAEKHYAVLASSLEKEDRIKALQLANQIEGFKKQKEKLAAEDSKFNMMDLLGVKEEDREDVKAAFNEVVGMVADFTAQQLELANQVVEQRTAAVEEKQNDLNTEIELNKLGFASNVETKRAELAEAKKQREEAIKDQQKAQRAQMAVDTITQTVGMVSASVDILKGFAKIPIIGLPLGIAAVGAMFAAFIGMKAKAMAATKYEKGGVAGGKLHSQGGNKYTSLDGNDTIEIEKGEFITNRKSTAKHLDWLEAINEDRLNQKIGLELAGLLAGTGVRLSDSKVAAKAKEQQQQLHHLQSTKGANYEGYLATFDKRLAAIEQNTTAGKRTTVLPGRIEETEGNYTRITRTR